MPAKHKRPCLYAFCGSLLALLCSSLPLEVDYLHFSDRGSDTRELGAKLDTKLDGADSDAGVERILRELQAGGLVDGFYEPYIAPRYQITKKGRESLV